MKEFDEAERLAWRLVESRAGRCSNLVATRMCEDNGETRAAI